MMKSNMVMLMPATLRAEALRRISIGRADIVQSWILEGLQDLGLIDHKDQLTDLGRTTLGKLQ